MTDASDLGNFTCPFSETLTRNLVLKIMQYGPEFKILDIWERREEAKWEARERMIEKLLSKGSGIEGFLEALAAEGPAYTHSREYILGQRELERMRMQSYRSITVSNVVPSGEEAEIERDPFKYLGLPQSATFEQVRAAWIRLSKIYHPDVVNPKNEALRDLIF